MAKIALQEDQRVVFKVHQNAYYPTSDEILNYFFKSEAIQGVSAEMIEKDTSLASISFSSRMQYLNFQLSEDSGLVKFWPCIKQARLNEQQILTLINYGYVVHQQRLMRIHDDSLLQLKLSMELTTPGEALQLASKFRKAHVVQNPEFCLVETVSHDPDALVIEKNDSLKCQLYPYQRKGVQWLMYCYLNKIGTLLGDDMGLGKTVQIIALIAEAWSQKLLKRAMIVVPNSLLENWRREFEHFFPAIKPFVHAGGVRHGVAESIAHHPVLLMPYSLLSQDIEMLIDLELDLLVFDEASLLKNPESERTKAASRLNRDVTIAMTGTPVENSLVDVWSVLNITNPNYLEPLPEFKDMYVGKTVLSTLEKDLSALNARISEVMLRRMKQDILMDLPEKIDIHQALTLNPAEKAKYEAIKESIRRAGPGQIFREITRLRQFTSHPILLQSDDDLPIKPSLSDLMRDSSKLERLIELIDEIKSRNEKVLIFCNYVKMINLLQSLIQSRHGAPTYKIDGSVPIAERQNAIDAFSAQKGFSTMVLNPTTAGMGLNITAANHVIHYSRQWNPALEMQATARAFRNGQTREVNVYYLYYIDTIEEVIDQRLRQKQKLASSAIADSDDKFAGESEQEFILKYMNQEEVKS